MKLQAEIANAKHDVEIRHDDDGKTIARVDDREYHLEVSQPEPGVYLFKNDGRVYEAVVSETESGARHVRIGSNEFDVRITDPKRLRSSGSNGDHADGLAEIRTAMPGKVVRILREAGSEVEKGEGILVVEAMKMQNELKSPKAGVVKDIRVTEGSTVSAGEVLAMIE